MSKQNIFEIFGINEDMDDDQLTKMVMKSQKANTFRDIDHNYGFYFSLSDLCGTKISFLHKSDSSICMYRGRENSFDIKQIYESEEYYIIFNIYVEYNDERGEKPLIEAGFNCTKDLLKHLEFIKKENSEERIIKMCSYDSIDDSKKYFAALSKGDINKANRMFLKYLTQHIICDEDMEFQKFNSEDFITSETSFDDEKSVDREKLSDEEEYIPNYQSDDSSC